MILNFGEFLQESLAEPVNMKVTSAAAFKAKRLGLQYVGFARYFDPKKKMITHKVIKGELVPVFDPEYEEKTKSKKQDLKAKYAEMKLKSKQLAKATDKAEKEYEKHMNLPKNKQKPDHKKTAKKLKDIFNKALKQSDDHEEKMYDHEEKLYNDRYDDQPEKKYDPRVKTAHKEFAKISKAWYQKIKEEEKQNHRLFTQYYQFDSDEEKYINIYTGEGYHTINKFLYKQKGKEERGKAKAKKSDGENWEDDYDFDVKNAISHLDNALTDHPAPYDFSTYSGISRKYRLQDMKPGKTFILPGYLSSSLNPEATFEFSDDYNEPIILQLNVKKGSKSGAYVDHYSAAGGEKEFLFKRNLKFKVVGEPRTVHLGDPGIKGNSGYEGLYDMENHAGMGTNSYKVIEVEVVDDEDQD